MNDLSGFRKAVRVFDWDYEPRPPFVNQWFSEAGSLSELYVSAHSDLEGAVIAFFDYGLPQRIGWIGEIVDSTDRLILLWDSSARARHPSEGYGSIGMWMGVQAPFTVAHSLGIADLVSLAIWEQRAKEATW